MTTPLTRRAEKTIAHAAEEAAKRGQTFVLPEHLLLALLREADTDAARVLAYRGIARDALQAALEAKTETVGPPLPEATHLSPRLTLALELARAEAESFGHRFSGTEHLLLGLIAERSGLAARLLARQTLTLESAREAVIEALWDGRDVRVKNAEPRKIPSALSLYQTPDPAANPVGNQELAQAIATIYEAEKWGWNVIAPELVVSLWALMTLFLLLRCLLFMRGDLPDVLDAGLLLLGLGGMMRRLQNLKREGEAAKIVSRSDSKQAIRSLIRLLGWSDWQIRAGAEAALTRLLPTLQASEGAILTENDRITLGRKLQSRWIQANPDFALAILTAFERVGASHSIYYVQPLTLRPPKTDAETRIYEAASRCLRALEWRAAHQNAHWTLLRPSDASADSPDVLLRPASAAGTADPDTLLRTMYRFFCKVDVFEIAIIFFTENWAHSPAAARLATRACANRRENHTKVKKNKVKKIRTVFPAGLPALMLTAFAPAQAQTPVTIIVEEGARQKFAGLGASVFPWTTAALYKTQVTPAQDKEMARLLWRDAHFRNVRVWFHPNDYAPKPGERNIAFYVDGYVKTGKFADVIAAGAKDFTLAPNEIPGYMSDGKGYIRREAIADFAALLADFIKDFKKETGVLINVAGIMNEPNDQPIKLYDAQWPVMIREFRKALDGRGLRGVKILAPESANCGADAYAVVDAIRADPLAWKALDGIATHSYNNAATADMMRRAVGKAYWITEAGGMSDRDEDAGDAIQAASITSRLLNDLNHGVTNWQFFIGAEQADPRGNTGRVLKFDLAPYRLTILQKYWYLKSVSNAIGVGAAMRHCVSNTEGEMTYTYGKKPRLNVAAARNADGTWGIGVSNFTSDYFTNPKTDKWHREQGGEAAQTFDVTIKVAELANADSLTFAARRSNSGVNAVSIAPVVMRHGTLTICNVRPLDCIALRSLR